jgi:hypothetical protein
MAIAPSKMSPQEAMRYRERARTQCLAWAQGRPYHEPINDECTPDFSCCFPDMISPDDERWEYYHKRYGGRQ